jgi:hypothetical protein
VGTGAAAVQTIINLSCVQEHLPAGRQESKNRDNLSRFFNKKAGNNLPILSVLCLGEILKLAGCDESVSL